MSVEATTQKVQELVAGGTGFDSSIKFVFNEGGVIHLDGNDVSNEDKEAACTINMELSDFDAMMAGDLNPMEAFMGGKMQLDGDMNVAMQLSSLFN
ncbi:SCP2 sterol-binding domain-containing protein [Microscilla marina]|uniref:Sterol carrier family protein n=1 Tax=Microscilla marina ATCC 23134 TaxID=313606 RepID=A1ZDA2_MICM2|nr:SCP2 sterol-binding domain-containing protein [Microscilla marina]EAY31641.1 sterol carrier family protein [Microscilla marina ATCC 23134]